MNRGAPGVFCQRAGSLSHALYCTPHSVLYSGYIVSTHSLIFSPYDDRYNFFATAPYANVWMKMTSMHCSTPGCALPSYNPVFIYVAIWRHKVSGPTSISQLQNSIRFWCIWVPLLCLLAKEPTFLGWKRMQSGLTKFCPWAWENQGNGFWHT